MLISEGLKALIRKAEPRDLAAVNSLLEQVLGYVFCIARSQGSGSLQPLKTLYIDDLCVDASARGRHIGKALFEYARDYAMRSGFYNITLHVWECNPGAKAFYETLGLKPQYTSMELICE